MDVLLDVIGNLCAPLCYSVCNACTYSIRLNTNVRSAKENNMSTGAATEVTLGELHAAIAKRLKTHVEDIESDPRYLQMAIKFVSDNKITCVIDERNDVGELDKSLQKRKQRKFGSNVTDIATKMAQEAVND